ncbi:MAG: ABC transporter substrate-binding protein [Microbacterium sp.]|uniref:ABC transporter substrate-binding protein n=1 Tax=Microbacterium sp. TaxID=51671 RepID=UPI00271B5286|nr:ABC transporter substrate-binding protein [Microbacterium sp.]MDO8384070.1 ABC transporter substrate-binding protein [Microbacterium sp.]
MSQSSPIDALPVTWNGQAFSVRLHADGSAGVAELGRWENVPRTIAEVALGVFDSGVAACEFYWDGDVVGAFCRTRIERGADSSPECVLIEGEPVFALPHGITRRELDVLTLVVAGISNGAIGERLHLSSRTVSTHVDAILRKLGLTTRTSAATLALEEGLISVPLPGGVDGFTGLRIGRALQAAGSPRPDEGPSWVSRALSKRPFLLGAALPLTGAAVNDGIEMMRGIQLAVEEINRAGGIHGRLVQPEIVDVDINNVESVRAAMAELSRRDVDVLTSGYLAHQDVAHDAAADAGLPYLHAATLGAMEDRVADDPARYGRIFQVCPSDTTYAPKFVEFMTTLRDERSWQPPSRLLIVLEQASWGLIDFGVRRAARLAEAHGWELEVRKVSSDLGESWALAAEAAIASDPAAVMIGSYFVPDHVDVIRRLQAVGSSALIYSIYAPSVPEFREELGAAGDGVLWATTTGTYSDSIGLAFASRFQRRFGITPGRSHAGIAYDRTHIIAQSWARTDDFRNFDQVAARIRTSTYRGVNGSYYFNTPSQTAQGYSEGSGDPSLSQAHLIYQIQGGRQEIVSPRPYNTARFQMPPWALAEQQRHSALTASRGLAY